MIIENLTNPGQAPQDGDRIRLTYRNGGTVVKRYRTPVALPPQPRTVSREEFLERFTDQEVAAIWRLADVNDRAYAFTIRVSIMGTIDLDSVRITEPLNLAVGAGKMTRPRVDEILA